MIDLILNARLDVLEHELDLTNNSTEWQEKLNLKKLSFIDSETLSRTFTTLVGSELAQQKRKLSAIRLNLKKIENEDGGAAESQMRKAWTDYVSVLEGSQSLFREFLEFLGALIFRDKQFDAEICEVADKLLESFARVTTASRSIAIPAARDALTKAVGRMVRVRFPEWTIWTLPFTTFEFGQVVFEESTKFSAFRNAALLKWLQEEPGPSALPAEQRSNVEARAKIHVTEFLADLLATYMMGPAYACSAILLRLDPSGFSITNDDGKRDVRRAYLVLEMLRRMNSEATATPYDQVIKWLDDKWQTAYMLPDTKQATTAAKSDSRLETLLYDCWYHFTEYLPPIARYPHSGRDGWDIAKRWAREWKTQLQSGVIPLRLPEDKSTFSKLRDVLNAAWLCRTQEQDSRNIKLIENVALQFCTTITKQPTESARQLPEPLIKNN